MTPDNRSPAEPERQPIATRGGEAAMRTTSVLPTPAVAGWTEIERIRRAKEVREQAEREGGRVIRERRIRNKAFDGPGERTTFEFTVEWEEEKRP